MDDLIVVTIKWLHNLSRKEFEGKSFCISCGETDLRQVPQTYGDKYIPSRHQMGCPLRELIEIWQSHL